MLACLVPSHTCKVVFYKSWVCPCQSGVFYCHFSGWYWHDHGPWGHSHHDDAEKCMQSLQECSKLLGSGPQGAGAVLSVVSVGSVCVTSWMFVGICPHRIRLNCKALKCIYKLKDKRRARWSRWHIVHQGTNHHQHALHTRPPIGSTDLTLKLIPNPLRWMDTGPPPPPGPCRQWTEHNHLDNSVCLLPWS